jgi:hypothetical protein
MPKVIFKDPIECIIGAVGNMVFYRADGQNLSRKKADAPEERSAAQAANSSRFKEAGAYAKNALTDPRLEAAYAALCVGHENPRNIAIRDFLRPPVVQSLSLDGYHGKPGDSILVGTVDDCWVNEMHIEIRDAAGNLIEEGPAQHSSAVQRSGGESGTASEWFYQCRNDVATGRAVSIKATAKDQPGHIGQDQRWHVIS